MTMNWFEKLLLAALILIGCGAFGPQAREREKANQEPSFETPILQHAELVEVVEAAWTEIADRCQTEQPVEVSDSPGRLVTLRADQETYRIFLIEGSVIHCLNNLEREDRPTAQVDRGLQTLVESSRADLAANLDVEPSEIEVLSAERVTWRDSSIGCPEAGRLYMQVLTEGARVILGLSGVEYRYHQEAGAEPFLCKKPSRLEPLPGPEIQ